MDASRRHRPTFPVKGRADILGRYAGAEFSVPVMGILAFIHFGVRAYYETAY